MSGKGAALVTGASARIGLAIARHLGHAGYTVVLHASPRSLPRAEAEAAALFAAGCPAHALAADLVDVGNCAALLERSAALVAQGEVERGPLRLVVNNAALFELDEAVSPDPALLDRHIAVNLRAPVLLAAALHARWDGDGDACVVNLIDQRVLRPDERFFSYTLAKAALWTATQTMARAFAAKGVRVNAVGPGPVLPNAVAGTEGFAGEVAGVPLRRAVEAEEVAAAVLYLAEARSVTGQMLTVDAGQHLGPRA